MTSGQQRKGGESVSDVIQSQFFLLVTHMHASVHTKLFVCIAISLHHIDVRNSVCNPFVHFFFKKQTNKKTKQNAHIVKDSNSGRCLPY